MITTLGYEELKRLHEERVTRSLRRRAVTEAVREVSSEAAEHPAITVVPCRVIEMPERPEPIQKLGA